MAESASTKKSNDNAPLDTRSRTTEDLVTASELITLDVNTDGDGDDNDAVEGGDVADAAASSHNPLTASYRGYYGNFSTGPSADDRSRLTSPEPDDDQASSPELSPASVNSAGHPQLRWRLQLLAAGNMAVLSLYASGVVVLSTAVDHVFWAQSGTLLVTSAFTFVHCAVLLHRCLRAAKDGGDAPAQRSEWELFAMCSLMQLTASCFVATAFFTDAGVGSHHYDILLLGVGVLSAAVTGALGVVLHRGFDSSSSGDGGAAAGVVRRTPLVAVCILLTAGVTGWTLFHLAPFSNSAVAEGAAEATHATLSQHNLPHLVRLVACAVSLTCLSVAVHSDRALHCIAAVVVVVGAAVVDGLLTESSPYNNETWVFKYLPSAVEALLALLLALATCRLHRHSRGGSAAAVDASRPGSRDSHQTADVRLPLMGVARSPGASAESAQESRSDTASGLRPPPSADDGDGDATESRVVVSQDADDRLEEMAFTCVFCAVSFTRVVAPDEAEAEVGENDDVGRLLRCDACHAVCCDAAVAAACVCAVAQYPSRCPHVPDALVDAFPWEVAEAHPPESCDHPVVCRACIRSVPFSGLAAHAADSEACAAGLLADRCPLCDGPMGGSDDESAGDHFQICPAVPVPCPLGCGAQVPRQDVGGHTTYSCPQRFDGRCPTGCAETFDTEAERDAHAFVCPQRSMPCPLGCAREVVRAVLAEHVLESCPNRLVTCAAGCGSSLKEAALFEHTEACRLRRERCPQGCGLQLPPAMLAAHIRQTCAAGRPCLACGAVLADEDVAAHAAVCEKAAASTACPLGCGETLAAGGDAEARRADVAAHVESCRHARVRCPNACGYVVARREVADHCARTCLRRRTSCLLCDGTAIGDALPAHGAACPMRRTKCPHKDCPAMLLPGELQEHLLHGCSHRLMFCPTCSDWFPWKSFVYHYLRCGVDVEKRTCPNGCGRVFASADLAKHVWVCNVSVLCSLGCGDVLRLGTEEASAHVRGGCRHAFVVCANGCGEVLQRYEQGEHNAACTARILVCPFACGEAYPRAHLGPHMDACPMRPVECPKHCGEVVRQSVLIEHMAGCAGGAGDDLVMECPFGCGVRIDHNPQHAHSCALKTLKCEYCDEMVPKNTMPTHVWKQCRAQYVACVYECGTIATKGAIHAHYACCPQAPYPCPAGCGAIYPCVEDAAQHADTCGARTAACPICGKATALRALPEHLSLCDRDTASPECPLGCGEPNTLLDSSHVSVSCRNRYVSCGHCGDVMPHLELPAHAAHRCLYRHVSCPYCSEDSKALRLPEHVAYDCASAPRHTCPLRCGDFLYGTAEERAKHVVQCRCLPTKCGSCAEWVFKVRDESAAELTHECASREVVVYPCPYGCGDKMEKPAISKHVASVCSRLLVACTLNCGMVIPRGHYADHCVKHCRSRLVECPHCDLAMPCTELPRHADECPDRLLPCKLGCGTMHTAAGLDAHVQSDCSKRLVQCPLGCAVPDFPLPDLALHALVCAARAGTGGSGGGVEFRCLLGCDEQQTLGSWELHVAKQCDRVPVACPNGCGVFVERRAVAEHLKEACRYRKVVCRHGCLTVVPHNELTAHYAECPKAPVLCPYPHCGAQLRKCDLAGHTKMCAQRPVPCHEGCGGVVEHCRLEEHTAVCGATAAQPCAQHCGVKCCSASEATPYHAFCPLAVKPCFYGCPESVPLRDMAAHCDLSCALKAKRCPQCAQPFPPDCDVAPHARETCHERSVTCAQGCGEVLKWMYLPQHAAHCCPKRRVRCRYRCAESLAVADVAAHELGCALRPVTCPHCGGIFTAESGHSASCEERPAFCEHCQAPMRHKLVAEHAESCSSRPAVCEHCRVVLPFSSLAEHVNNTCPVRATCPDCGAAIQPGTLPQHKHRECPARAQPCRLCGVTLRADEADAHGGVCGMAVVACVVCGDECGRDALPAHEAWCRQAAVNEKKAATDVRPFLGLDVADYMVYGESVAACVRTIVPGSGADDAGLEQGGLVLAVDGADVRSRAAFLEAFSKIAKPFAIVDVHHVPRSVVLAVEGRKATPEEQRATLLRRAASAPARVGTLPRLSPEEYFACQHRITLTCLAHVTRAFDAVGRGIPRVSSAEVSLVFERLQLDVPPAQIEAIAAATVGYTLLDTLEWLLSKGYVGKLEASLVSV